MPNMICGKISYENCEYTFNYRNDILVIQSINKNSDFSKKRMNIEGITHSGKYICFIQVKFSKLGNDVFQSSVPAYIIAKNISNCEMITEMKFTGECIDRFYYPKRVLNPEKEENGNIIFELNKEEFTSQKITINKDIYSYGVDYEVPITKNTNNIVNVKSLLEIKFGTPKNVADLIEYYMKIEKFFCFVNNRKYITFDEIIFNKTVTVNIFNQAVTQRCDFYLYVRPPEEKIDLNNPIYNKLSLDDIKLKYRKIYNIVTREDFSTHYYPYNKNDSLIINDDKIIQISSAFEFEFNSLFFNFKSKTNLEYSMIKNGIIKHLDNKKSKLKKKASDKSNKKLIKYNEYFKKIISNIDGTLEEKIIYTFNRYNDIMLMRKNSLLKSCNISKAKNTDLAKVFSKRRNDISHGNPTNQFTNLEIISYELLLLCVYCLTLERCEFSQIEIQRIIYKILII